MKLEDLSSHTYDQLVDYFHEEVDRRCLDHPQLARILHMIITFCSVYPLRDPYQGIKPFAPKAQKKARWMEITVHLQREQKALFLFTLHQYSAIRVNNNLEPVPIAEREFEVAITSRHKAGQMLFDIFRDYHYMVDYALPIWVNCCDSHEPTENSPDTPTDRAQLFTQLNEFVKLPQELKEFRSLYDNFSSLQS